MDTIRKKSSKDNREKFKGERNFASCLMEKEVGSYVSGSGEKTDVEDEISGLPTSFDCMFRLDLYNYNGFWFFPDRLADILRAQKRFVAKPEDILVCSFPKTGTTWLKSLAFATANRERFDVRSNAHPLITSSPHNCVPFFEVNLGKILNSRENFRVISTHAPLGLLPESVRTSDCKILYIWRDPKDVFISGFYYATGMDWALESNSELPKIDEALHQFCEGVFFAGPYWDHVIGFLKESEKRPNKVLCCKYEDLRRETSDYVRRLAQFISQPFSPEEEEQGVVKKIVDLCSFETMQSLETTKTGTLRSDDGTLDVPNHLFLRRGEVGDWKNHLTDEMAARIDDIFNKKLADAGLMYPA